MTFRTIVPLIITQEIHANMTLGEQLSSISKFHQLSVEQVFNPSWPFNFRQHERQEPSSGLNIGSTLERLKKKPTSVDPVEVSNKLLTKLKTMPKSDVKDLINNPKQQFRKTVLNIQAKQNIREQNRQKLRTLGNEGDIGDLEVDEAIDCRELPGFLNDLTKADSDTRSDENIEVVQKNLGTDFLSGSEMLLMTGFSLLGDNDEQPQFEVPEVPPLPTEKQRPPLPQDNISAKPTPVPAPDNSIKSDKERFNFISFYQSPRDWEQEVEKSKNPDPPPAPKNQEKVQKTSDSHKIVSIQVCDYAVGLRPMYSPNCEQIKNKIEVALPSLAKSPVTVISEKVISPVQTISKTLKPQSPFCSGTPKSTSSHSDIKQPETPRENNSEPLEKRNQSHQQESLEVVTEPPVIAKMTYGDHKRKLAEEHHKQNDDRRSAIEEPTPDISLPTPPPQKKQKGPQSNQNTSRDRNWTNNRWVRNEHNNQQRNQNNTNNNNNRKSRIDMDRDNDRDRDRDRRWSNAFSDRSISNNRDKEMSDVHTQRANNDTASTSNPFNRKNHERIPVNQSPVRDFAESSYVPANDFRPCYYTLKKIMDMDAEITKVHEKIHTLDIIIQGHHSERVIHQKAFNKLQHDRKVLFDNLMKRASTSEQRSKSSETRDVSASSAKQDKEKKSQPYVDDRKKKQDEIYKKILDAKSAEEHAESVIEKQKSEKEKAARLQKEREKREQEERDLKKLIEERKRKKLQRIKRQEDEKLRLERRICQEEVIKITTIKSEPRESSNDRQKSTDRQKSIESQKSVDRSSSKTNDRQKSVDRQKPVAEKSTEKLNATNEKIFRHETLNIENFTVRECSVKLDKLEIPQNKIDIFLSEGVTEIDSIDDVAMKPIIADESIEKILPDNEEDENDEAIDNLPPMTSEKELLENQSLTELASDDQEYKEWTGNFNSHTSAIVDLQVADGKFLLAACEDGKVLKYNIHDGSLVAEFHEHKEICNAILYDNSKFVYSVSSDGYLNQINFEVKLSLIEFFMFLILISYLLQTFDLKSFEDFREALQVIEKSKTSIFVGSKNGNIYRLQHDVRFIIGNIQFYKL